jgi:hypothetical protein
MAKKPELTDDDMLVMLGTDPREWTDSDDVALARLCGAASGDDLARLFGAASGDALARLFGAASGDALARLFGAASGDDLARLKKSQRMVEEEMPKIARPYSQILAAISGGGKLEMNNWHTCKTTHCIGGWTVHLAGKAGYDLESKTSTPSAAALILRKSRPDAPLPNFYASNEAALAFIRKRAAEEEAQ